MPVERVGVVGPAPTAEVVQEIFGDGGILAQHWGTYRPRPGQIELAKGIFEIVAGMHPGSCLAAEAPCGVGKSYAALSALIVVAGLKRRMARAAQKKRRPDVLLTKTIALQEQYIKKDLPAMEDALGRRWPFTYAILKGRGRYVCQLKVEGLLDGSDDGKTSPVVLPEAVVEWIEETTTGDQSECPVRVSDALWRKLSSTSDECMEGACPYVLRCYANVARSLALSSDIVVANYHAVMVQGEHSLGMFDSVICDEAHELPAVARSVLGWSVSKFSAYRVAYLLGKVSGVLACEGSEKGVPFPREIRDAADRFFGGLLPKLEEDGNNVVRIRRENAFDAVPMLRLIRKVRQAAEYLVLNFQQLGIRMEPLVYLRKLHRAATEMVSRLAKAQTLSDDDWTHWFEGKMTKRGDGFVSIEGRPYRVAGILGKILYPQHPGTVLMSATLRSTDGFGFFRREAGLPDATKELVVESPFALAAQAALVIPNYVPVPPKYRANHTDESRTAEKEYMDRTVVAAADLIRAMEGSTLCLFTSWRALEHAWELLMEWRAAGKLGEVEMLRQEPGEPVQPLVRRFSRDESSVLLGVRSLWEGVDVPGNSLRGLYINKIPFPVPSDPINAAMSEWIDETYGKVNGRGRSFDLWSLPQATTAIQQGMGRLIRSIDDRGVLVVADARLVKYGYGKRIVAALPRFARFPQMDLARKFLPQVFERVV